MLLLFAQSDDRGMAAGTVDDDDVLPATKHRRWTTDALYDPPARAAAVLEATTAVNAVGDGRRRAARIMPRQLESDFCYQNCSG